MTTTTKTIETKQMNGYAMEKRNGKFNRLFWVGIIGGKVVAKGNSKGDIIAVCSRLRQESK